MAIDAATRDSLELTRSIAGSVAGSLLGEIDRCQSAAGRRLLCEEISAPLTDRGAIERRLALVAWLNDEAIRRERVRQALKAMPDFARALARLAAGRGSPRDLALLRDGLAGAAALRNELEIEPDRPKLLDALLPRLGGHAALVDRLRVAVVESPPIDGSKGGYIAEGYDAALDALRESASNGRRAIAALEVVVDIYRRGHRHDVTCTASDDASMLVEGWSKVRSGTGRTARTALGTQMASRGASLLAITAVPLEVIRNENCAVTGCGWR